MGSAIHPVAMLLRHFPDNLGLRLFRVSEE